MKKIFAALTAVTLAAGLSLAAVVAPASADDAPAPTPSATSTPDVTPTDTAPAPVDPTPAPADTAAPDVAPPAPDVTLPVTVQAAVASFTVTSQNNQAHKAFVCKYVGTPGVNERLQTGQNPIDVSLNAIGESPVVVGSYFNDGQGRSYVLALDNGQPDPSVASCPAPTPTYETVVWSMPSPFNGSDPTYPQVGVTQYKNEQTQTLNVSVPTTCGTQYQVDVYAQTFGSTDNTSALNAMFAAGLAGPNGAQDGTYLAGAGSNPGVFGYLHAWKFVQNPACTPPPCVPDSKVSYTYFSASNSGVITVPNPAGFSGVLCTPFYVTAASWTFDTAGSVWTQTIHVSNHVGESPAVGTADSTHNLPIQNHGAYPYSATVGCGQGDIYASFTSNTATLFPENPGHLAGPSNPFTEHFLSDMGFTGPSPTYTVTGTSCNTLGTPVTPTVDPITACGVYGSITIPNTPGVVYTYNGVVKPAGTHITGLQGAQSVIATPASGYKFANNAPSVTYNLNLGTYITCAVTTTDPTSANPTCTGDNSPNNGSISILSNVFVEYTLTGPGIVGGEVFPTSATDGTTETIDGLAPGAYTVTATGLSGHTINGQSTFQFNIITLTNPNCTVVAPSVSWDIADCGPDPIVAKNDSFTTVDTEVQGVIHLPVDGNVTYQIDGVDKAAGGSGYSELDGLHTITATLTPANITAGIKIAANPGVYTLSANDTVATWTVTFVAGCLPVLPAWNAGAVGTDALCSAGNLGTITLTHSAGQGDKVDYVVTNDATSHVVYSGTDTSDTVLHVAAAHYTVTAAPHDPADGIAGNAGPYLVTVGASAVICGDPSTLAFTGGTIGWFGFVLAGGMLFLGIAFLLMRRRQSRIAE
jgi:hypothetical protein